VGVTQHPRWADATPEDATWRAPRGRRIAEARAEQDRAAGGADRRAIRFADGSRSTGSVELKLLGGRRIYAYLRYTREGRTVVAYVGEARGETREERLRAAWTKVHADGLLTAG
jgi:DNA mismatch endonuclease (patch repair protein)